MEFGLQLKFLCFSWLVNSVLGMRLISLKIPLHAVSVDDDDLVKSFALPISIASGPCEGDVLELPTLALRGVVRRGETDSRLAPL